MALKWSCTAPPRLRKPPRYIQNKVPITIGRSSVNLPGEFVDLWQDKSTDAESMDKEALPVVLGAMNGLLGANKLKLSPEKTDSHGQAFTALATIFHLVSGRAQCCLNNRNHGLEVLLMPLGCLSGRCGLECFRSTSAGMPLVGIPVSDQYVPSDPCL